MKIFNQTQKNILASDLKIADTFISRLTGLLTRTSLNQGEGLLITRCQSIHMFFMRFPIDVVFVDSNNHIVGLVENIKPFQWSPIFFKASYAIEGNVGMIKTTQTTLGDWIQIKEDG